MVYGGLMHEITNALDHCIPQTEYRTSLFHHFQGTFLVARYERHKVDAGR
ncbi:hypothetical protein BH09BAC4_BH09BAC4_32790 [soil metagenome]